MDKKLNKFKIFLYLVLTLQLPFIVIAQESVNPSFNRVTLLTTARNMIEVTLKVGIMKKLLIRSKAIVNGCR